MSTFKLSISTPDRLFYSGDVEYLSVDTPSGRTGIMRGALSRICAVKAGRIDVKSAAVAESYYCGNGIMSVNHDGVEILLSSCSRNKDDISSDGATAADGQSVDKTENGREFKYAKAKIASSIIKMKDKTQSDDNR